MGKLITLKNGETRTILDTNDVLDIIQEFLGEELVDCLKYDFKDLEDAIDNIYSDKCDLEAECESYALVVFKVQNEIDELLKQFNTLRNSVADARSSLENIKEICIEENK